MINSFTKIEKSEEAFQSDSDEDKFEFIQEFIEEQLKSSSNGGGTGRRQLLSENGLIKNPELYQTSFEEAIKVNVNW